MGELLVRTWHESQGKPIYVVEERRRRRETDAPAPRLTRVLFLAESFHPVLGGGETHIRLARARLSRPRATAVTVVTRRGDAAWPADEKLVDGIRVRARAARGAGPDREVPDGAGGVARRRPRGAEPRRARRAGDARPRPARASSRAAPRAWRW